MGYISLDSIIRSAIASKGSSTLHMYVLYLHFAFKGLEKFQREGVYTDIKSTKDVLDENNCLPFPEDMKMWSKIGIVVNGEVQVFVNNDGLSLDKTDHDKSSVGVPRGLFTYDSDSLDFLYTTNIFVSTGNGVIVSSGRSANSFRVNWRERKFQMKRAVTGKVYLEYVAKVHNPSTATIVNELATEYIENYIYYREARFKFGSGHRETLASEREWLESQDDLRADLSNITGEGIMRAMNMATGIL